uniref:Candidate secreted effector n=1 Tax=Meloidogyne incognita TaxID=6306 RepID=A0A914KGK3_MELIC
MSGTFRQMLGECSSICFGICRSSSGICLESVFVGVLTAGVWNSPGSAWSSSFCLGLRGLAGIFMGLVASMVL